MLVSAILGVTISYHSYFKVRASLLMSATCTNEVVTTQLTVLKIQTLTVKIASTILQFEMLALCQVALLFKLAIALLRKYPSSDVHNMQCMIHPCMHDEST